jgi:anti-sigma B factor antagonist
MRFDIRRVPGPGPATHYRLSGELDIAVSGSVADELRAARQNGGGPVVVDLSRVSFIDSSGLRALLLASSNGDSGMKPIVLACPSTAVTEILELTGVDRLLTLIYDTSPYEWPNVN